MTLSKDQIKTSFWAHRPEANFPPPAVNFPEDYVWGSNLNLICTQLDLSSYKQKKLVEKWCQLLPELTNLRYLWFSSRTNQAMFEAACEISTLEGLFIDWGSIKDLKPLENLPQLKYLHLGSSPSVESIQPLHSLTQMVVLHIENFKHIQDLTPLSELTLLEGLAVEGSIWTTQIVESLRPLRGLKKLQYLYLSNLKASDNTLLPLLELVQLENLVIGYNWPKNELRLLKEKLPELKYGSLLEDEFIEKFGKNEK